MVILDTNIIIDHLRQNKDQETILAKLTKKHSKETLALSIISVQELYSGKSTEMEEKEKDLLATIGPLRILPFTFETAQTGGKIARDGKKEIIDFTDAAIAATAIVNKAQLLTLNKKHFQNIKDLEFFEI